MRKHTQPGTVISYIRMIIVRIDREQNAVELQRPADADTYHDIGLQGRMIPSKYPIPEGIVEGSLHRVDLTGLLNEKFTEDTRVFIPTPR